MTREDAIAQMRILVGPDSPVDPYLDQALGDSLTWDSEGRVPGDPDYAPTWDLNWALGTAFKLLALRTASTVQGQEVTKVTSEGTSFEVLPSQQDWFSVSQMWYRQSPMHPDSQGYITVALGSGPYRPTSGGLLPWI